jgi:hypothetical protein
MNQTQVDWFNAFGVKPVRRHYVDFAVFWNATPESRKIFMASLNKQGFELCFMSEPSNSSEAQRDYEEEAATQGVGVAELLGSVS